MRIYMNTNALNRPFDDLGAARVRREAEAVLGLIEAFEQGRVELVSSQYLEFEAGQDPDRDRVAKVRSLLSLAKDRVAASSAVIARARALEQHGVRGLDALHLASAETGRADLLVTTDDRLLRRSKRATGGSTLRVVSPQDALAMVEPGDEP